MGLNWIYNKKEFTEDEIVDKLIYIIGDEFCLMLI